ncbi:MAG: YgeY family selenium metabolism-linked hydrolase [Candidatus Sumerlaeota bacterium]|nr:YgeY family selenium metabolism-linked hydrolase [Candidatus Sumerlaeota bacterium]
MQIKKGSLDFSLLRKKAEDETEAMVGFLRDLIALPSPSGRERDVALRIREEMDRIGFDEAFIDDYGSVIGRIGKGSPRLVFDGHIDTVGVADLSAWSFDPFKGKVEDGYVCGRGASDNKAAPVVQIYGLKVLKELVGGNFPCTVYIVGSVQEEACDGLALGHAIQHSIKEKVDAVVLGECTGCAIYRGHRGRMEIMVSTAGISSHASAPERGDNAIYKMAPIIKEVEALNVNLKDDPFLGKGTIAVTKVECDTDSINCIPYACRIYLDRRLTTGEDRELALRQIRELSSASDAGVKVLRFAEPSYTGKVLDVEKYYPTWVLPEEHRLVQDARGAYLALFGCEPKIGKWTFSTNGVSSMGRLGISTIGFGPGEERFAHTNQDKCPIEDLRTACAFYAALPLFVSK